MINTYTSGNKPDLTLRKLFQAQAAQQQAAAATAAANNPFSGMTPQNLLSATPKNILQVSFYILCPVQVGTATGIPPTGFAIFWLGSPLDNQPDERNAVT